MRYLLLIMLLLTPTNVSSTLLAPNSETLCLTKVIYHESRGEPFMGQVAVSHVVMNRLNSPKYPKTVCQVVYQPSQFTDIQKVKPKFQSSEWKEASRIAIITYNGLDEDPTFGALYYYAHNKIKVPLWAKSKKVKARINNHTFLGD